MNTYEAVRDSWEAVAKNLHALFMTHSVEQYYAVRSSFNEGCESKVLSAARFIYLNRTGFNGIYRENRLGQYNVPFGKLNPWVPQETDLKEAAAVLANCEIRSGDFERCVARVGRGSLVFADPPYPSTGRYHNYQGYTASRFDESEQERLADALWRASERGAIVFLSHPRSRLTERLYKGWTFERLSARRSVAPGKASHTAEEFLVSSCDLSR